MKGKGEWKNASAQAFTSKGHERERARAKEAMEIKLRGVVFLGMAS